MLMPILLSTTMRTLPLSEASTSISLEPKDTKLLFLAEVSPTFDPSGSALIGALVTFFSAFEDIFGLTLFRRRGVCSAGWLLPETAPPRSVTAQASRHRAHLPTNAPPQRRRPLSGDRLVLPPELGNVSRPLDSDTAAPVDCNPPLAALQRLCPHPAFNLFSSADLHLLPLQNHCWTVLDFDSNDDKVAALGTAGAGPRNRPTISYCI